MVTYLIDLPDKHPLCEVLEKHCGNFIKWQSINMVGVSMEDEFEAAKALITPIYSVKKQVKKDKVEVDVTKSVFDGIVVKNEEIQQRVNQAKKYEKRLKTGRVRAAKGLDLEEGVTRGDPLNRSEVVGKEKEIQC